MEALVDATYWSALKPTAFEQILSTRIMPLNKVEDPNPGPDDIRFICMQSHTVKFLEECLRGKLTNKVTQESIPGGLLADQHGFIK